MNQRKVPFLILLSLLLLTPAVISADGTQQARLPNSSGAAQFATPDPASQPTPASTLEALSTSTPACTGSNQTLAYISSDNGIDALAMVHLNGSAPQIVPSTQLVTTRLSGLAWAPKGRAMAFSVGTHSTNDGIYLTQTNLTSTTPHEITSDAAAYGSLAWAPDGVTIAAVRHDTSVHDSLVVMFPSGGLPSVVVSGLGIVHGLTWSPDSGSLAYAVGGKLYLVKADGSGQEEVSPAGIGTVSIADPSWSPDGQHLVFSATDQDGSTAIDELALADETAQVLYPAGAAPVWSPDGSRIAFVQARANDAGTDLFVMNADGTHVCQLTDDTASETSVVWRSQ